MMVEGLRAKVFSRDKAVRSRLLNALGAQVVRTLVARAAYQMRPALHSEFADEQQTLRRDGVLVIPNFLPEEQFEQTRREALDCFTGETQRSRIHTSGPNKLEIVDVKEHVHSLPRARQFFEDSRLRKLLEGAERRRIAGYGVRTLERLIQGPQAGTSDPETDLHSDIFYPVHKCWLYLTDVTLDSGPLVYVKRSHLLTARQLMYLYQESCGPNIGSRRISPQEMEDLNLVEDMITCKMNTLVIANTMGYHRRAPGRPDSQRIALHESLRSRPFALR